MYIFLLNSSFIFILQTKSRVKASCSIKLLLIKISVLIANLHLAMKHKFLHTFASFYNEDFYQQKDVSLKISSFLYTLYVRIRIKPRPKARASKIFEQCYTVSKFSSILVFINFYRYFCSQNYDVSNIIETLGEGKKYILLVGT